MREREGLALRLTTLGATLVAIWSFRIDETVTVWLRDIIGWIAAGVAIGLTIPVPRREEPCA